MKLKYAFLFLLLITIIITASACSSSSATKITGHSSEGSTITGKILSSQQMPIPYAEIEVYQSQNAHKLALAEKTIIAQTNAALRMNQMQNSFTTRSNEMGEFTLSYIPDGEYTLRAFVGDAQQYLKTNIQAGGTRGALITLDAVLTPTGTASGKIKLNTIAIEGVVVYLEGTKYVAITDEEGIYRFDNIPISESYKIKVLEMPYGQNGDQLLYASIEPIIAIEMAANTEVSDISLTTKLNTANRLSIRGMLVNADTSQPKNNRMLVAVNTDYFTSPVAEGQYIYHALTDSNGLYEIFVNKAGSYVVSAIKRDKETLTPETIDITVEATHNHDNPAECTTMLITKGFKVTGVVKVGSTALASVILKFTEGTKEYYTATNNDGEFTITVTAGTYEITTTGYELKLQSGEAATIAVSDNTSGVNIAAEQTSGTVTVAFEIQFDDEYEGLGPLPNFMLKLVNEDTEIFPYFVVTNALGSASIDLPVGNYTYSAAPTSPYILEDSGTIIINGIGAFNLPELDTSSPISRVAAVRVIPQTPSTPPVTKSIQSYNLHGFEATSDYFFIVSSNLTDEIKIESWKCDLSFNYTTTIPTSGFSQVSTALYNNHLFVLINKNTQIQGGDSSTEIYGYTEDLILVRKFEAVSMQFPVDNKVSLFATDVGLYTLTYESTRIRLDKISASDPTRDNGNNKLYPELYIGGYFKSMQPCYNNSHFYVASIIEGDLTIKAYNKMAVLSEDDTSEEVAIIGLPGDLNLNDGPPSVYLSCRGNDIYVVLQANSNSYYFIKVTHDVTTNPYITNTWTNSNFDLQGRPAIFGNSYVGEDFAALIQKDGYGHLYYPTIMWGTDNEDRLLTHPFRANFNRIYVLGQDDANTALEGNYQITIFNADNWPQ